MIQKQFFLILWLLGCLGIGLMTGYFIRTQQPASVPSPTATRSLKGLRGSNFSLESKSVRAHHSLLSTQLDKSLKTSFGVDQWFHWFEALETAELSGFPGLAVLAKDNLVALRFVAVRWAEKSPRHLFDTLLHWSGTRSELPLFEFERILCEQWSKSDLAGAISAVENTTGFGRTSSFRKQLATAVFDQNVEQGLQLLSRWKISNYSPLMDGVTAFAAADPRHAAEVVLANNVGFASTEAIRIVAKEWAKTNPRAAIEFAINNRGDLASALSTTSMNEWAARNLEEASEWLRQQNSHTKDRLIRPLMVAWGAKDPEQALAWCQQNLAGSSLAQSVGSVLGGVAEKDIQNAALMVSNLEVSAAREEAAATVAKKWMPEFYSSAPMPSETIQWIASLDPASQRRVLEEVRWNWIRSDPQSLAIFLAHTKPESVPEYTYSNVALELSHKSVSKAFEWASSLPPQPALEAGAIIFEEWRGSNHEPAMQWWEELPETDSRKEKFFNQFVMTLPYNPQATEILGLLTPPQRERVIKTIPKVDVRPEFRDRLMKILTPK